MVTVQEYDKMSAAERQQTIDNLMGSDPQNAQILMIREQELQGQNTVNPTVRTREQAAEIREAQAYNREVYEAQQARRTESQIVNVAENVPVRKAVPATPVVSQAPSSWESLGYPEFEGKYESPVVPSGYAIKDLQKTEAGISFSLVGRGWERQTDSEFKGKPAGQVVEQLYLGRQQSLASGNKAQADVFDAMIKSVKTLPSGALVTGFSGSPLTGINIKAIEKAESNIVGTTANVFLPPEPGTASYGVQGNYVVKGATIYDKSGAEVGVVGDKSKPFALREGEVYDVVLPSSPVQPQKVKQSDLGVANQFLIGLDALYKVGPSLIEQKFGKDTPASKIAKLEFETAGKFGLDFAAGEVAAIESNIYGTAGLAGSIKRSFETGELTYAPGFEGFDAARKTPVLAPSAVSAATGAILGEPSEGRAFESQSLGYRLGSALTEANIFVASGKGLGYVGGKALQGIRTSINPKINQVAESVLARSKIATQVGLEKVKPGLGIKVRADFYEGGLAVRKAFDVADNRLGNFVNSKFISPVKNTVVSKGVSLRDNVITVGPRASDIALPKGGSEEALFMRSIARPNLGEYSKVAKLNVNLGRVKTVLPEFEFKAPAGVSQAKGVARQIIKAERIEPVSPKGFVRNPLKDIGAEVKQTFKAESLVPKSVGKVSGKSSGQIVKVGLEAEPKVIVKSDAFQVSKMTKAFNNQLKASRRASVGVKSGVKAETVTLQVPKEVAAVKPVKLRISGAPNLVKPYPGTSQKVEYDTEIVAYPTARLTGGISKGIVLPSVADLGRVSGVVVPVSGRVKPLVVPSAKIVTPSVNVTPQFVPSQVKIPSSASVVKLDVSPLQRSFQVPRIDIPMPKPNDYVFRPPFPEFGLGGGGGSRRRVNPLRGKWRKQNNPIKSPEKVLASIGIKTPKNLKIGLGVIDKSLKRIDKSVDKSLKRSSTKGKSKGRSKRKR